MAGKSKTLERLDLALNQESISAMLLGKYTPPDDKFREAVFEVSASVGALNKLTPQDISKYVCQLYSKQFYKDLSFCQKILIHTLEYMKIGVPKMVAQFSECQCYDITKVEDKKKVRQFLIQGTQYWHAARGVSVFAIFGWPNTDGKRIGMSQTAFEVVESLQNYDQRMMYNCRKVLSAFDLKELIDIRQRNSVCVQANTVPFWLSDNAMRNVPDYVPSDDDHVSPPKYRDHWAIIEPFLSR